MLNIADIRKEFPILSREVNDHKLVYLDNTATSQTPERVVQAIINGYEITKSNVHRGVHTISQEATDLQENTRRRVKEYINANSEKEIIFTRGTTEAINLVAATYGQRFKAEDEIILTVMEHHANIVPWQLLQKRIGFTIKVVDIDDDGILDMDMYRSLFNEKTVFASFCHVSNVLGTINPIKKMISIAHAHGVPVLIDGAQAAPHLHMDMQDLDCDFYVFSSHKMYGPTGVGILYGKERLLEEMPPYQGGGEMISHVSFAGTTFAELPFKFEAGTPDFVDIAAFSQALDFIQEVGLDNIARHENELLNYATEKINAIPDINIYGKAPHKSAVLSFLATGIHPYDLGFFLDKFGVAVRTGHHCAQPLMDRFGIPGTVRASFAVYNTKEEVDIFCEALQKSLKILRHGQ